MNTKQDLLLIYDHCKWIGANGSQTDFWKTNMPSSGFLFKEKKHKIISLLDALKCEVKSCLLIYYYFLLILIT